MAVKQTIYLVPHTHYDAVWAFTKEDYFHINIELILRKTVDLFQKPQYRFLFEQTALLEEIERRNPSLFEKISRLIKKGKIEIADGEYLMADNMIPDGEVLIRQILSGKRYAKQKFGVDVPVMWGADSFGFNAQFPQIMAKSGYKYFAFRRGADKNSESEFMWEGLDGTRILSHWMPLGYRAGLDLSVLEKTFDTLRQTSATRHVLIPSGSGSTPPQPDIFARVKRWNSHHSDSHVKIAKVREFFEAVEKDAKDLEVRRGEMYSGRYSEVFPNVSSSRIWIKQSLRKYENLILDCEKWATIAWLLGIPYPSDEFLDNWRKVLWGTFHDVAAGAGMDQCYDEARDNFAHLQDHLPNTLSDLLLFISQNLVESAGIVVFNPSSWGVKNWVEVDLWFEEGHIHRIEGLKSGNEEIAVEVLESTHHEDDSFHTAKIGFVATVPALGYRTYKILGKRPMKTGSKIRATGNRIQNQFFTVKVDPSNGLIDVIQDGKVAVKGNELVLEEEIGDLYYHRQHLEEAFKTERDEGVKFGEFKMKSFKINKTPLRTIIESESDYYSLRWPYRFLEKTGSLILRHSYLSVKKKVIIYEDIPRIDFQTVIDNRHPQVRIRVKFSTGIDSPTYSAETQFGVIDRPANQYHYQPSEHWVEKPCGIYPSQTWIDYSDGKKGVTLINRGLPSHEIRDGEMYLTLLRSVLMLSSDGETGPAIPTPDAQEFKTYKFEYSLYPHRDDWKAAESFKQAYEYNHSLTALQVPETHRKTRRKLSSRLSFIELKPNNLIIVALKKAEDSEEAVIRFYETKGTKTLGVLKLFRRPRSVKVVNLLEKEERVVQIKGKEIHLEVNPFEIISLKIKF